MRVAGLVVDQRVEDLVDHPHVPLEPGELLLDVHQVLGQPIQAGGGHPQHGDGRPRMLREEGRRVVDDPDLDRRRRPDRRRGRAVEHPGHLAEHRTRVVDPGEGDRSFSMLTDPETEHQHADRAPRPRRAGPRPASTDSTGRSEQYSSMSVTCALSPLTPHPCPPHRAAGPAAPPPIRDALPYPAPSAEAELPAIRPSRRSPVQSRAPRVISTDASRWASTSPMPLPRSPGTR